MADPVHILVTGGAGQVGLELLAADWPEGVILQAAILGHEGARLVA